MAIDVAAGALSPVTAFALVGAVGVGAQLAAWRLNLPAISMSTMAGKLRRHAASCAPTPTAPTSASAVTGLRAPAATSIAMVKVSLLNARRTKARVGTAEAHVFL